jgi:hypothetical protein
MNQFKSIQFECQLFRFQNNFGWFAGFFYYFGLGQISLTLKKKGSD